MEATHVLRLVVAVSTAVTVSACATVSRGIGSITENKYAEARSGTVWAVEPPQLEPVGGSRTVYISYRNISDAQDLDLLQTLRGAAQQQGWELVSDPDAAKIRLRASLRFFGEVQAESGGLGVANGLGTIAGAAVSGYAVGRAVSHASGSFNTGVAAGGLVGGLVAAGLSNASRPREYAAILDFLLEERTAKPITVNISSDSASARGDVAGTGNARMGSGGGQVSGNTSSTVTEKTTNYFPHGVRLSAWANQMSMKEEEALPLITAKIERVVTQLLPQ